MIAFISGLHRVGFHYDRIAIGQIKDKERPCMDKFHGHAVNLRRAGNIQQQGRLITPVIKYPVQHETDRIGGDHGHLAGHGKEPAQITAQGRIGS